MAPAKICFTLVELVMVVIAIIGILCPLILTDGCQPRVKRGPRTQCKNNVKQLELACMH